MTIEQKYLSTTELYSKKLEEFRREKFSINPCPLPSQVTDLLGREVGVKDMSESGLLIEIGAQHLRESIVNGQRVRTQIAFMALKEGMHELEVWLKEKGYL